MTARRCGLTVARLVACAVTAWLGPLAGLALAGPKVDAVVLRNGDRITCEIKKLDRARLDLSTDAMDAVAVHWDTVAQVSSPRAFEVEVASGAIYYGSLAVSVPGQLDVVGAAGDTLAFPLATVIRLTPIGTSFWGRVDGTIDFGFSFSQAATETRVSLNSTASYRTRRYVLQGAIASQLTTRQDVDRLSRNTLDVSASRLVGPRWFTVLIAQLQQNEELALDLRGVAGGGAGRYFSKSNSRQVGAFAGLAYTRERFSGQPIESSGEAVAGATLDFFSSRDDDFSFTTTVTSYHRLGGERRARVELQSALRHVFYKDFYWSVNGFESFDSAPPEGQKRNDAGVSVALGWKF